MKIVYKYLILYMEFDWVAAQRKIKQYFLIKKFKSFLKTNISVPMLLLHQILLLFTSLSPIYIF